METTKTTYEGWKNYQTWNIALWIGNDEGLYNMAIDYMKNVYKGISKSPYRLFVKWAHLTDQRTPDNISFSGSRLDYTALNEMMKDLLS